MSFVDDRNLYAALMLGPPLLELGQRIMRPRWMAEGACLDHPDVEFFPARGESTLPAKALCATCQVRDACLDFALEHSEKHGIWGGTSERERRKLRRQHAA